MDDGPRLLVLAQALKRGLPQLSLIRPFGKCHLGDQLGADPMHAASVAAAGWIDERRLRLLSFLHAPMKFLERPIGKAGPGAAGIVKLSLGIIHAEKQRAERRARPGWLC